MVSRLFCSKLCIIVFGFAATFLNPPLVYAGDCGGPVLQVGWFAARQGKSQHVNIQGLVGDDFKLHKSTDQSVFVGAGYYFDGLNLGCTKLLYGVNAFYLTPTKVKGKVVQENLYTNLSYHYSRTNYPIYLSAKGLVHCNCNYDIVIDLGIGPNIIRTHNFKEYSLDGGITIPDDIFSSKSNVAFSATAGLGCRFNKLLGCLSFEISYRFFYLGEGKLKKANNQVKNNLRTGNSYANALCLSFTI